MRAAVPWRGPFLLSSAIAARVSVLAGGGVGGRASGRDARNLLGLFTTLQFIEGCSVRIEPVVLVDRPRARQARPSSISAATGVQQIQSDPIEPGVERAALPEGGEFQVSLDEGVLRDFLGVPMHASDMAEAGEQLVLVLANQLSKGI